MPKQVALIPLDQIMRSGRNPRSQLGDLSGLRASLGSPEAALLAQLPVVQPRAAGGYELIVGERRLESARLNGWAEMECVVRDDLTPHRALAARIVENLHRQALHPLDEAFALRVLWLVENAQARGLEREAEQELRRTLERPSRGAPNYAYLVSRSKEIVGKALYRRSKSRPMILPVVTEL